MAQNISRLDLQMTYEFKRGPRAMIRRAHKSALRESRKFSRGPSVTLVTGSDGSDTLYLGKRTSDVFGRLYAKGIESKDPAFDNCVRAECELKGSLSTIAAREICSSAQPLLWIHRYVYTFFTKRGVVLPVIAEPCVIRQPRKRTDLDKRLLWLSEAVRPSIQLLIRSGRGDDALRVLGVEVSLDGRLVESFGPSGRLNGGEYGP